MHHGLNIDKGENINIIIDIQTFTGENNYFSCSIKIEFVFFGERPH